MALQAQSALGLLAIPLLALLLSEQRRAHTLPALVRIIGAGLLLQLVIAAAMLNIPASRALFDWAGGAVQALQAATLAGVRLVFGYLAGGPAPFDVRNPTEGFILAFQALPVILVISALSKLAYHWGLLQPIVRIVGRGLQRTLGVSGPVGTSAAANILVGMVEAPLLVRPYLAQMSRAGLFATMTAGMAGRRRHRARALRHAARTDPAWRRRTSRGGERDLRARGLDAFGLDGARGSYNACCLRCIGCACRGRPRRHRHREPTGLQYGRYRPRHA